jgi:hypothetical protein
MYIHVVAESVMLCLRHDFYNIIFKIKHKLYIASGSAPSRKNFWVLTWFQAIQSNASMVAQTPVPLPNSARAIYVYKRAFVVFCNLIPHLGNRVAYSHRHLGRLAYRGYAARTGKKNSS